VANEFMLKLLRWCFSCYFDEDEDEDKAGAAATAAELKL